MTWASSIQQTPMPPDMWHSSDKTQMSIPVWQQMTDLSPFSQGGTVNDAPSTIPVERLNGRTVNQSVAASNASWSPERLTMDLAGAPASEVRKVPLSSAVRNGCYDVVVKAGSSGTTYGVQPLGKAFEVSSKAQLFIA